MPPSSQAASSSSNKRFPPTLLNDPVLNYVIIAHNNAIFIPIFHALEILPDVSLSLTEFLTFASATISAHPIARNVPLFQLIHHSEVHLTRLFANQQICSRPCPLPLSIQSFGPITVSHLTHNIAALAVSAYHVKHNASFSYIPIELLRTFALLTHHFNPLNNLNPLTSVPDIKAFSLSYLVYKIVKDFQPSRKPQLISTIKLNSNATCNPEPTRHSSGHRHALHALSSIASSLLTSWFSRYMSPTYILFNEKLPDLDITLTPSVQNSSSKFYTFIIDATSNSRCQSQVNVPTDFPHLESLFQKINSPETPLEICDIISQFTKTGQFPCAVSHPEFYLLAGFHQMSYVYITSQHTTTHDSDFYTTHLNGIISIPLSRASHYVHEPTFRHPSTDTTLPVTVCRRHFPLKSAHDPSLIVSSQNGLVIPILHRILDPATTRHNTVCDPDLPELHELIEDAINLASLNKHQHAHMFSSDGIKFSSVHSNETLILPDDESADLDDVDPS
jgi:hypothetical protein